MGEPLPPGSRERPVATEQGEARVLTWRAAGRARADLLLQHGANGKLDSADLARLAGTLPALGVTTRLLQQPFAVAGKRIGPRPAALDAVLGEVVGALRPELDGPLVLGGRSAGARCTVRRAGALGAVGALALAFPLHPPGRPDRSRAVELLGCEVPTLVVQGSRDPFGGPDEFPDLPEGTDLVEVPGADHGFGVRARDRGTDPDDHLAVLGSHVAHWLDTLLAP